MKKTALLLLIAGLATGWLNWKYLPKTALPPSATVPLALATAPSAKTTPAPQNVLRPVSVSEVNGTVDESAELAEVEPSVVPMVEVEPSLEAVIHSAADFSMGRIENLVIEEGQLKLNGKKPSGTLCSPEFEAGGWFSAFALSWDGAWQSVNQCQVEVRLRHAHGWSEWERISINNLNQPMSLGAPARAWQYRLTLTTDNAAQGPVIASVTIAPQNVPSFQANETRTQ